MIGATTTFDANEAALKAIVAEWTSGHDFATRIANLSGDAANSDYFNRLNGDFFLIPVQTAFADGTGRRTFPKGKPSAACRRAPW